MSAFLPDNIAARLEAVAQLKPPLTHYATASGVYVGAYLASHADPAWIECAAPPAPQKPATDIATQLLSQTDYVEFRHWTPERTPSPAWLAWREQLREVVRGNATEIPPEPERYNAP